MYTNRGRSLLTGGGAVLFGLGEVLGDLLVGGVGCGIAVKI